ncbi:MAG: hypothetical protein CL512_05600 [Actinobacteria bacterium]|nr:hypothetical protein [Actinomycetota bacterium]|tara:strand:+ start:188 stop:496 length:309 start_codon:yes stop_codon:yes gene_type:complete
MKIRLEEEIVRLGDYRIVRVDDYNLELQNKNGELLGYYGFMCHAVRQAFALTMNDVRRQGKFNDVLGSETEEWESGEELANSVPQNAIYDFKSEKKAQLIGG